MKQRACSAVSKVWAHSAYTHEFPSLLVLAGIELISVPVAAVFWIKYKQNIDSIDVFSCC